MKPPPISDLEWTDKILDVVCDGVTVKPAEQRVLRLELEEVVCKMRETITREAQAAN